MLLLLLLHPAGVASLLLTQGIASNQDDLSGIVDLPKSATCFNGFCSGTGQDDNGHGEWPTAGNSPVQ
jgi:hypothetical protein